MSITASDLADTMERCAVALRAMPDTMLPGAKPMLQGDYALGAAVFWTYLRDLLTAAGKDMFTRDELLVALEAMSRDHEMFPGGLCDYVAALEKDEATG